MSSFTTDTIIWTSYYSEKGNSIEFDYINLSVDDAILDLGTSNYGNTFNRVSTATGAFPYTLDVTTNKDTINGVEHATLLVQGDKWKAKYIAIKVTKVSAIASTEYLKWTIAK